MFDQTIGNPFAGNRSQLLIAHEVIQRLIVEGHQALPHEYSALLAGHDYRIIKHYPAASSDTGLHTFAWSGATFLSSLRKIHAEGLEWIGVYHTHPSTPATPSTSDQAGWHYPSLSYWIGSYARSEQPDIQVFQMEKGIFINKSYSLM